MSSKSRYTRRPVHPTQQVGSLAHERELYLMRDPALREFLAKGGKLLRKGSKGAGPRLVRNVITGRVYPCCWTDCERNGSTRIQVMLPHEAPRFKGECQIYIFCSDEHKSMWMRGH